MVMIKITMMLLKNELKRLKSLNYLLLPFLPRKGLLNKKIFFLILTKIPKLSFYQKSKWQNVP